MEYFSEYIAATMRPECMVNTENLHRRGEEGVTRWFKARCEDEDNKMNSDQLPPVSLRSSTP